MASNGMPSDLLLLLLLLASICVSCEDTGSTTATRDRRNRSQHTRGKRARRRADTGRPRCCCAAGRTYRPAVERICRSQDGPVRAISCSARDPRPPEGRAAPHVRTNSRRVALSAATGLPSLVLDAVDWSLASRFFLLFCPPPQPGPAGPHSPPHTLCPGRTWPNLSPAHQSPWPWGGGVPPPNMGGRFPPRRILSALVPSTTNRHGPTTSYARGFPPIARRRHSRSPCCSLYSRILCARRPGGRLRSPARSRTWSRPRRIGRSRPR